MFKINILKDLPSTFLFTINYLRFASFVEVLGILLFGIFDIFDVFDNLRYPKFNDIVKG